MSLIIHQISTVLSSVNFSVRMVSTIFAFFLFLLSARAEVGVYEEIYPRMANFSLLDSVQDCDPDTSPDGTCPLFFGLLSSLGGIYKTSGCIPAVQMALDEINKDPFLLPGYSLHYTFKDSQVCCIVYSYIVRSLNI